MKRLPDGSCQFAYSSSQRLFYLGAGILCIFVPLACLCGWISSGLSNQTEYILLSVSVAAYLFICLIEGKIFSRAFCKTACTVQADRLYFNGMAFYPYEIAAISYDGDFCITLSAAGFARQSWREKIAKRYGLIIPALVILVCLILWGKRIFWVKFIRAGILLVALTAFCFFHYKYYCSYMFCVPEKDKAFLHQELLSFCGVHQIPYQFEKDPRGE